MGTRNVVGLAFAAIALFVVPAWGSAYGDISGVVIDTTGNPLADVAVVLENDYRDTLAMGTTDWEGRFFFRELIPDIYYLSLYKYDYGIIRREIREVWADRTTRVTYELVPGCVFTPGDANGNGVCNGADVLFLLAFLEGGPEPPVQCNCPPFNPFYPAADVDGNCEINLFDALWLVVYFKGGANNLGPGWCLVCPPKYQEQ
jgi:hypothetical protein